MCGAEGTGHSAVGGNTPNNSCRTLTRSVPSKLVLVVLSVENVKRDKECK